MVSGLTEFAIKIILLDGIITAQDCFMDSAIIRMDMLLFVKRNGIYILRY